MQNINFQSTFKQIYCNHKISGQFKNIRESKAIKILTVSASSNFTLCSSLQKHEGKNTSLLNTTLHFRRYYQIGLPKFGCATLLPVNNVPFYQLSIMCHTTKCLITPHYQMSILRHTTKCLYYATLPSVYTVPHCQLSVKSHASNRQ